MSRNGWAFQTDGTERFDGAYLISTWTRFNSWRQYVEHTHKVKQMMQPGQCPACDEQWGDLSDALASHCPFCEKLIYFTVVIAMAWQCPLCYEKWSGPDAYYRQHPDERPDENSQAGT